MYTKKNTLNDKIKLKNKMINIALLSTYIVLTLQYFIIILFGIIDGPNENQIKLISKTCVAIFYFLAFINIYKKDIKRIFLIYLISFFIFIFNYYVFSENRFYISSLIFPFFFMSMPSLILSLNISDFNLFLNMSKLASYIVFILTTIISCFCFLGLANVGTYSMTLSYYMLFPSLFFLLDILDRFTIFKSFLFIISLIIIISYGSRGPLLCIAIFIIIKIFKKSQNVTYNNIISLNFIFVILIIFVGFYKRILFFLNNSLLAHNIRSRTLTLLLKDNIHLSGRDNLYGTISNYIFDNPFWGIGLAGDGVYLDGSYSHNLFLELFSNFGIIAPLFIIILILCLIIKAMTIKNTTLFNLFALYFCLGFIPLMVSGSYITSINFWIFIGLLFRITSFKNPLYRQR